MKLIILIFLLVIVKPVLAEIYTEQYGSIKLTGTSFFQDVPTDNRNNTKLETDIEYNFYLEKDTIEIKLQSKVKLGNPALKNQFDFNENKSL